MSGIYEDFRGGERPESKADVESMALETMFVNIKSYDYERTKFEFDDTDRETEKGKGDDFVR